MSESIRVVVADDQTSIRDALETMLDLMPDIDVVATAANGSEAVDAVAAHTPDVVLMDLRMPVMGGVEATRVIGERFPSIPVVVLTTFDDESSILDALGAGAKGYLTKDSGRVQIAHALRSAAAGQTVLDVDVQGRLVAAATRSGPATATPTTLPDGLTKREGEVLSLIAAGLDNRQIAARLFIGEATVKTHINNLFAKTGVEDRAKAVHYAFTHGLGGTS